MKLTVRDDSKNYTCVVVSLPVLQDVVGLDKLKKVTIFGNDVLVSKDSVPGSTVLFFPAESVLAEDYLSANNEYRHENRNLDQTKKGFFEDSGRVKAIKFKGVISSGYVAPVESLDKMFAAYDGDRAIARKLKVGDEFTDIDGINICKKYKPVQQQSTATKESRYQKKLKRFDKLVPNQFRFHQDTSPLARNLHVFNPEDQIVITDKWHGTSAVFANVQVKAKLNWREKIARGLWKVVTGESLGQPTKYDNLYSSRSVIKNQYINEEQGGGYYGEDIWAVVNGELAGKIEQGITLYGEIVGYLPSGKEIQKGYDYGCHSASAFGPAQHKFVVYRITYTKPNGEVIEFSWNQIKSYCKKYQISTVPELFVGKPDELVGYVEEHWHESLLNFLQSAYLEKDCTVCKNKVPAEGVCVRIDGRESYSTYKLKAKRFLERETKQLDANVVDIETES